MNKYLTGLVAVATITSVTATSVPAAEYTNLEHAKSVITEIVDGLMGRNLLNQSNVKDKCNKAIKDTNLKTDISIDDSSSDKIFVNVDILGDEKNASMEYGSIDVSTTSAADVLLDTFIIERESTTAQAVSYIKNNINDITLDNDSDSYSIENIFVNKLHDLGIYNFDISIHNFKISLAYGDELGKATGYILFESGNSFEKIPFAVKVNKSIDDSDDNENYEDDIIKAFNALDKELDKLNLSLNTTEDEVRVAAEKAIDESGLEVNIDDIYVKKTELTETQIGRLSYTISLSSYDGNNTGTYTRRVEVDTKYTKSIKNIVRNYLEALVTSNNMDEDEILDGINKVINDSSVQTSISNFYLKKSINIETEDEDGIGYCYFSVNLKDANENKFSVYYDSDDFSSDDNSDSNNGSNSGDLDDNSGSNSEDSNDNSGSNSGNSEGNSSVGSGSGSSGGSSSSHNSHSSSTSSSTSSESSTNTNTINEIVNNNTLVALGNMSKEDAKNIESNVINNIGVKLGAIAGQSKEILNSDGIKLSITEMSKDNKTELTIIRAEGDSQSAIIPIEKGQTPVVAVYKYISLLNKYIQVKDASIEADKITLPVQNNATYVALPIVMAEESTVKEGWGKVDNNWYMLDQKGDILTGWQKDNNGWTYMSQSTGIMSTGWLKEGDKWYYLDFNGYMSTGWIKVGYDWYYCNSDGSMAYNTIVDGYKVGLNGEWQK